MAWVLGYGCTSAAGNSTEDFWKSLVSGRQGHRNSSSSLGWENRNSTISARELLLGKLLEAYAAATAARPLKSERLGVILASTKGFIEDLVWQKELPAETADPMTGLLNDFLAKTNLKPKKSLCVSNACASSLSAIAFAERWFANSIVDDVLVIAADTAGPFVQKGFESLQLLTQDQIRSFAQNRTGFLLGEAATAVVISKNSGGSALFIRGVGLDAEGSPVTRPTASGESLVKAAKQIPDLLTSSPDLVVAHGTATHINDVTEDLVFDRLFHELPRRPAITSTKWCVGHTLAVSGSLDLIAACEMLKRQQTFKMPFTDEIDVSFQNPYLSAQSMNGPDKLQKIFISSLGFGGIHASTLVEIKQGVG